MNKQIMKNSNKVDDLIPDLFKYTYYMLVIFISIPIIILVGSTSHHIDWNSSLGVGVVLGILSIPPVFLGKIKTNNKQIFKIFKIIYFSLIGIVTLLSIVFVIIFSLEN